MHRTRHSSLDYLGANMSVSTQEEWSEFLSTSMMALSTTDAEDADESARAPTLSPASPRPQTPDEPVGEDTFEPAGLAAKPHGVRGRGKKSRTMSESLAGSMSPPPLATDVWRPLGRRMSPSALTRSSSSSSSSSPPSTNNQVEPQPLHARLGGVDPQVTVMSTTASPAFGRLGSSSSIHSNADPGAATARLKHTSSFREVVNSCLSSSGSSFYDSSSDEEQQNEGGATDANQAEAASATDASVPAPPPVDSAYAESCLPVLSQLPRPPRSISVDSGSRSNSLSHVKSPVLSNRKDSQTWQLQDEEFFMTSPRFGASLRSTSGSSSPQVDLFRGNSVGSLVSDEGSNQYHEEFQGHQRLTKESRALSVDFTLGRSQEVSPPLPPPQEPLQRLRARSFSYSQAYGSSGYNPAFNKQQFVPPHHQHQAMPPQEYPATLRGFHGGATGGMMPPPNASQHQPHPPHVGVRPPRVSIPTDSPMHQYHQYGPPMPYRRYSTDTFAMAPYPESYGVEQQENQAHQGNSGRGLRSYSMEYGSYSTSSRQVRSQSMEGPQLFATAAPPMDFPPSLSRSNSAGVAFDWPRGARVHAHMEVSPAPPLPPDTRANNSSGNNSGHFPQPPPEAYYDVEFKRGRQEVFAGRLAYKPGEYVKVEADRGEDIGRIVQRTTDLSKLGSGGNDPAEEPMGRGKRHDLPTKKIICVASARECEMLNEQRKEEHEVFEVCKSKVRQRLLPMNVIDAEYQFDRHKLTFFFEADRRIDFRELVRDLFAIYKTRIWLQQVVPSGKKTGSEVETN